MYKPVGEVRPALFVRLLGEPLVEASGGRHAFGSDKRHFLLAYLALEGERVRRDRLARLFWPDSEPQAARHNLRQVLKRIRSLPWGPMLDDGGSSTRGWLRWAPATDVQLLQEAIEAEDWSSVLDLHRGRLLAGLRTDSAPEFAHWLEFERLRLSVRFRDAILGRTRGLLAAGDVGQANVFFAHLLADDSYDEEALHGFMVTSAALGNRARALGAYERFAEQLSRELGLTPMSQTQALAGEVRDGVKLDPSAPLVHESFEGVPPPSAAVAIAPGLPPGEPLVGREEDVAEVHRLLAQPSCRLVTITGPGGVGKSRLARFMATELAEAFGNGLGVITVESPRRSSRLLDDIAAALEVRPAWGQAALESVGAAIAERKALLVCDFDDLEDPAEPSSDAVRQPESEELEQLGALLQRCPGLSVLATSRQRLNLAEEWLLPLGGLQVPGEGDSEEDVRSAAAVRLFVARARRLDPRFTLAGDDLRIAGGICRALGGLPLAIELAASWTRFLPLGELAASIGRSSDEVLSASGSTRGRPRHRSMLASFEHSWRRLTAEERRSLAALTVFEADFELPAAAVVAGTTLVVLAALVDKSLLRAGSTGGFGFHLLVREFASAKLASDPQASANVQDAHARFFMARLSACFEAGDFGSARLDHQALVALDARFADVAVAWRRSCAAQQAGDDPSVADATRRRLLRWSEYLTDLCVARGRYAAGAHLLEEAVTALAISGLPNAGDTELRGSLLARRSWFLYQLGRLAEAEDDARQALSLLAGAAANMAMRTAHLTLGSVALQAGRYEAAEESFTRARRAVTQAIGRGPGKGESSSVAVRWEIARLANGLGVTKQYRGDREGAAGAFQEQLQIQRVLGDLHGIASTTNNLGNVMRLLGRFDEARELLAEGLQLAASGINRGVLANLHVNLGVLDVQLGDPEGGKRNFAAALAVAREQGKRLLEITALFQIGRSQLAADEPREAAETFLEGLELTHRSNNVLGVLDNLTGLAWSKLALGERDEALRLAVIAASSPATTAGTRQWARELTAAVGADVAHSPSPHGTGQLDYRAGRSPDPRLTAALELVLQRHGGATVV